MKLVEIGRRAELFLDERGDVYARFHMQGKRPHFEIRSLRSRVFGVRLSLQYFLSEGKPPAGEAVESALRV